MRWVLALKGRPRLARLQLRRAGVQQEEPASLLQVERRKWTWAQVHHNWVH